MISCLKKYFKWSPIKTSENRKNQSSLVLAIIIGILEDVLFWKKTWLSLSFIIFLNVFFVVCIRQQINCLEFIFRLCIIIVSIDAFEAWLKYKHRTMCLKKLANHDCSKLNSAAIKVNVWLGKKWSDFTILRENNHTKAYLLINIILSTMFIIGKYINGYLLLYSLCMVLCISKKLTQPLTRFVEKIKQNTDSDEELNELIPEISDLNIKLLSVEPENSLIDEKHMLDYWKPEDLPLGEASDSSENSSSIITNLSMDKMQTLQRDVETSDSSEDEYIPLVQQNDQLRSTLEIVQPANTWSGTAYNAFWNFTETVSNMMYNSPENKRNRVSSIESSDGFEMIDKNDL